MLYNTAAALALAGVANAFPGMTMDSIAAAKKAQPKIVPRATMGVPKGPVVSSGQTNCGPIGGCPGFNYNSQKVETTGAHAFSAPSASDLRGPCPGLNAAANHGYLPRDGLAHITDTITGLGQAYSMSVDLAGFLAAYAVIFDGDLATQSWSIGGPSNGPVGSGLLGAPQGISYSHNKYEGDSSATRADAYMNGGDAYKIQVDRFSYGYTYTQNGGYTLDSFRQLNGHWVDYSEQNNDYYFAPLFSTTLVSPAAYNFVINFMSNHSAEQPDGFLSPENYATFFGMSGTYPNFEYVPERFPDNFVKRPSTKEYNAVNVFQDLAAGWAAYPNNFRFGGNINGKNTYEGINLTDATGGAFHDASDFANADNARCFFAQTLQQFIPDELKGLVSDVTGSMKLITPYMSSWTEGLSCPALDPADPSSLYSKYPGAAYSPKAPGT